MIYNNLKKVDKNITKPSGFNVNVNFVKGAFAEINSSKRLYKVEFKEGNNTLYEECVPENHWVKTFTQYYVPYEVRITDLISGDVVFSHNIDLRRKRVVVELSSKALGDTLAWFPYAEEFRKKHECELIVTTFHPELFEEQYPDIKFLSPGATIEGVYAWYQIGWYYNGGALNNFKHPREVKTQPMQKTASDILGLDFKEIRPLLSFTPKSRPIDKKYVCIANHSTAQAKYWNNEKGWEQLCDYLVGKGYEIVNLSKEGDGYMGNKNPENVVYPVNSDLTTTMNYMYHCEFFVGLGSGLSWLSWAMNIPTVIISGFSEPYTEPVEGVIRVDAPEGACRGCFNKHKLNAGDWKWCPENKNFECSRLITAESVISKIQFLINKN